MALPAGSTVEKALRMLRGLPRVALNNIADLPNMPRKPRRGRGQHHGYEYGFEPKHCPRHRCELPPLGFEGGSLPYYLRMPKQPYYAGHHARNQFPPFTLTQLQRALDLGRLDPRQPIDLTAICNALALRLNIDEDRDGGILLSDEGADCFAAKINIEVQRASEPAIAAVERNGGTITARYYDPIVLHAVVDPLAFFKRGSPIPRCALPPASDLAYYASAKNRGYLAEPEEIAKERLILAQKYGYTLPDLERDPDASMLRLKKDPRQIFYGLEPGWIVSLRDKAIFKPTDPELQKYYAA